MTRFRPIRVLYLALRDLRSHSGRSALMVTMVGVGLLVFLFMTALAATSSEQLDEAVNNEFGVEDMYSVSVPTDLAVSIDEIDTTLVDVLVAQGATAAIIVADFGGRPSACVNGEPNGSPTLVTVLSSITPERLNATGTNTTGTDATGVDRRAESGSPACVQGMAIPVAAESTAVAVASVMSPYDPIVVLPRTALGEATAAYGRPERIVAFVQVPGDGAAAAMLTDAVATAFSPLAQHSALDDEWSDTVQVSRADDGFAMRNAQRGVNLVYSSIGWAVLGIGALALLVAQMMNARNRVWFFGLSRVWGASPGDLVAIACVEVAILVGTAGLIVVIAALALTPSLDTWSQATFQESLVVLRPETFVQLFVATAILAAVGALLPAYRAATTDPLDAIE